MDEGFLQIVADIVTFSEMCTCVQREKGKKGAQGERDRGKGKGRDKGMEKGLKENGV